jgi:hypothetical protein
MWWGEISLSLGLMEVAVLFRLPSQFRILNNFLDLHIVQAEVLDVLLITQPSVVGPFASDEAMIELSRLHVLPN